MYKRQYYHDVEKEAMRQMVLNEGIRLDGRDSKTIRPIWSEVDYLPGAHGSAAVSYTHLDVYKRQWKV